LLACNADINVTVQRIQHSEASNVAELTKLFDASP
jgi:hypothetical protein